MHTSKTLGKTPGVVLAVGKTGRRSTDRRWMPNPLPAPSTALNAPSDIILPWPETTPRTRPEALTLRDQFDLFETRASDFGGSYRSLVPQKRPRKTPDIRIARQESPKYTCCKSNRPFIGDLEQFERYAVRPSDRSSAIAMRLGVPDERRERERERERERWTLICRLQESGNLPFQVARLIQDSLSLVIAQ